MAQLSELTPLETVWVDGDRLVELCFRMGEGRGEEVIAMSVENLWRGLEASRRAFQEKRFDDLIVISQGLSQIADNLGLSLFSKVCRDVGSRAARDDPAALSACLSRLHRVADQSINSVWDLCDITD